MKQGKSPSRGPLRVGLMALHDKKFFAQLLKEPRKAMQALVAAGELELTDADMDEVVALIKSNLAAITVDPMVMWQKYHDKGVFDPGDWADLWKER